MTHVEAFIGLTIITIAVIVIGIIIYLNIR